MIKGKKLTDNIPEKNIKFYSIKAIAIASYFGGPLAAGFLIRRNYINLGMKKEGLNTLIMSIIFTVIVIGGLLMLPDIIVDKIPNYLIPFVYTGIICLIMERLQGDILRKLKDKPGMLYSGWRAAGIGLVCALLILCGAFGYIFLSSDDFDAETYDSKIAEIQDNETAALMLFDFEGYEFLEAADFIKETGIPIWEKNIKIVDELDALEGISEELRDQNRQLREYFKLRIQEYSLIRKSIIEDTNSYDIQIEEINYSIDNLFEE